VKPADLLSLLEEFHRDTLGLRHRHVAAARFVEHYDYNNTYQYVIAREDTHAAWLCAAIAGLDDHVIVDFAKGKPVGTMLSTSTKFK